MKTRLFVFIAVAFLVLSTNLSVSTHSGQKKMKALDGDTQTFADVPPSHPFYAEIERIAALGITVGCEVPGHFCPDRATTRAEAAVFLERAAGIFHPPDTDVQTFEDVPPALYQHRFIEDFTRRRITSGCAPNLFCPTRPLTREEAAVFIVRAIGFINPPETAAAFSDVGPERLSYRYVNFLASRGITNGCGNGLFCPDQEASRGEMAAFIVRGFGY